jgi:curved DNA-binding protein CbpA
MLNNNFNIIDKARKLLELPELVTIDDLKSAYRNKIKIFHPDKNRTDNDAHWKTMEIMEAYKVLVKYCQNYKFSFKKEDYIKQNPMAFDKETDTDYAAWWQNFYGDDPLWGHGENRD